MAPTEMQKMNLNSVSAKKMGDVTIAEVELKGLTAQRIVIHPGGSWSKDLKEGAGTSSCQKGHVGIILSGRMKVKMDDGIEETFGPDDVVAVPPGHDTWTIGDEPAVFIQFSRGTDLFA
jgi:hypothetical protein